MADLEILNGVAYMPCGVCATQCPLRVSLDAVGAAESVAGSTCMKGSTYGQRTVSEAEDALVKVAFPLMAAGAAGAAPKIIRLRMLGPVPKKAIARVTAALQGVRLTQSRPAGFLALTNVANTGVDAILEEDFEW